VSGSDLFTRLKAAAPEAWASYTDHAFVRGMADGTLPQGAFRHYLAQDYLFLTHFARAYALAVYKGRTLADMRSAARSVSAILDTEMSLHVRLCTSWGLSEDDLGRLPESRATMAYTRFVLEAGLRGDVLDLHVALSPCVLGYGEIAAGLASRKGALSEANPYRGWIEEYSGTPYQAIATDARKHLDDLAERYLTPARFPEIVTLFEQASRLEADFWQMGLTLSS